MINKQLKRAAEACERHKNSIVTAPIEIPQLCNQLGHFEAKINGHYAHVGVNVIPVVGYDFPLVYLVESLGRANPFNV